MIFFLSSDKPEIAGLPSTKVNESYKVILTAEVDSNPLSSISWYSGSNLLQTRLPTKKDTFTIEKASCTDTKNFTIVASNSVKQNVTALLELIVNCKLLIDSVLYNIKH